MLTNWEQADAETRKALEEEARTMLLSGNPSKVIEAIAFFDAHPMARDRATLVKALRADPEGFVGVPVEGLEWDLRSELSRVALRRWASTNLGLVLAMRREMLTGRGNAVFHEMMRADEAWMLAHKEAIEAANPTLNWEE